MKEPITFEYADVEYKAERLNGRAQFHLARRLSPYITAGLKDKELGDPSLDNTKFLDALVSSLANAEDAELDYIIDKCLSRVQRKDKTTGVWQKIYINGELVFDDLDEFMPMIMICGHVLVGNLKNFF